MKKILIITMAMPFLTSCGPAFLKKLLKDHPEIVIESIKSHPEKYMEALAGGSAPVCAGEKKKAERKTTSGHGRGV